MVKIYSLIASLILPLCLLAQDLTIDGAVTVQSDGLLYVKDGDVIIKPGGTLEIQSSGSQRGTVFVDADGTAGATWTCNGNTYGTGEVEFWGDADYTLDGNSVSFPHLIIDVAFFSPPPINVSKITLNNDVTITESLTFNSGRIVTGANEIYVENSDPNAIAVAGNFGDNFSNYVEGTLRRAVVTGANNYYRFPIGGTFVNNNPTPDFRGYNPVSIDLRDGIGAVKPANVTSLAAKFTEMADIGDVSVNVVTNDCYYTAGPQFLEFFWMVRDFGYWSLIPDGDTAGWNYDMYCFPDKEYLLYQNPGLTHLKIFNAAHELTPGPGADWSKYFFESGEHCDGVTVYNNGFGWIRGPNDPTFGFPYFPTDSIRASGLTHFSHDGLAGGTGAGLPIELLYLQAEPVNNEFINVKWATATEINNSGFEIHRSTDGVNFSKIGWEDGAGNSSSTLSYGYPDHDVVPNVLYYYRLKQIDYDGTSELTYVVSAMITSTSVFTISEFMPNPTEGNSRIEIVSSSDKDLDITVYNTLGQIINRTRHHVVAGTNQVDFNFNLLADGTYYAIINADNEVHSRKLILTK